MRRCIHRLDRAAANPPGTVALGIPEIDGMLPWGGLPRGALNEAFAAEGSGSQRGPALAAVIGFAAMLADCAGTGVTLWCCRGRGLYGPGLAALGLDPGRLIVARGRSETDVLWAMEEGLRGAALATVIGEVAGPPPVALRRLQLAAEEAGDVMVLMLHAGNATQTPSPAATRWRIAPAPSVSAGRWPGPPRWHVELLKCRGGACIPERPLGWIVEWRGKSARAAPDHGHDKGRDERHRERDTEAGGFAMAAELRHRPAAPAAGEGRRHDRMEA